MEELTFMSCRGRANGCYYGQAIISFTLICFVAFSLLLCQGCMNRNGSTGVSEIPEVRIGDQVWMARNFDGVTFRNGDSIPEIKSAEAWDLAAKTGKPAWCYYENDTSIGKKY